MRLSQKIFIGIVVMITGLMIMIMTLGNFTIKRGIEQKIRNDLLTAQSVFSQYDRLRFNELLTYNRTMVELPHIKAAVGTPDLDPELIHTFAGNIQQTIKSDLVMMTDATGKLLADVSNPKRVGEDLSRNIAIKTALQGRMYQGIWEVNGRFYQVVTNPFKFGQEVAGVLLTGFSMDEKVMASLGKMTACDVAIISPSALVESGENIPISANLKKELMQLGDTHPGEMVTHQINGENYLLLVGPFDVTSHYYVLSRSVDKELAFFYHLQKLVFIIAGGGLALALLLGLFFTRRITQPIRDLVANTQKIASGDLSGRVPDRSGDEFGDLAKAFNRMSEALQTSTVSKKYLDSILKSMLNSLVVLTPDLKIKSVNEATCRLLGYSENELLGHPVRMILGQEQETGLRQMMTAKDRLDRMIQHAEKKYLSKNKQEIPVSFSAGVIQTDEGKVQGLVLVAQDITERRELEQKLLQAQKMESVGQLAAGVAHEINNPLGVIYGFAQSLAKRITAGDPLEMPIKSIEREAARCEKLVQDLLEFSRSGTHAHERLDVNETIEGALALVQTQSKVKDVEIQADLSDRLPNIRGNKNQIQQVVVNLCNNAVDAMTGKSGKLTVRTRLNDKDGMEEYVVIEVEDNGGGIPEDLQTRIFEPFFTTKEVGKGTGLGLALVYEIIHSHKGEIDFRSFPGKGTTFCVRLPVYRETAESGVIS